jgi:ubiquinone/menaquinone biosynthesis C-methylase UbiE
MFRTIARSFVTVFVLAVLAPATGRSQGADAIAADATRLVQALTIRAGSVVAELGAGDGALTIAIARIVGEQGRVFSTELSKTSLEKIDAAVAAAGLKNVTVVEGTPARTNLPEQCCDAIFMRDVYHHFTEPQAMNASVLASLKPGGVLGVLEFGPPPGAESPDPAARGSDGQHGITPATLERELKAAGFEVVSTTPFGFRGFLMVARRFNPSSTTASQ